MKLDPIRTSKGICLVSALFGFLVLISSLQGMAEGNAGTHRVWLVTQLVSLSLLTLAGSAFGTLNSLARLVARVRELEERKPGG